MSFDQVVGFALSISRYFRNQCWVINLWRYMAHSFDGNFKGNIKGIHIDVEDWPLKLSRLQVGWICIKWKCIRHVILSYAMSTIPSNTNIYNILDRMVHGVNMGPTWVLSAAYGPHVGPMNLAIRDSIISHSVDINNIECLVNWHAIQIR